MEIRHRVSAALGNWKKCGDRKMTVKLRCGAETWATTKRQDNIRKINEVRMLRWMCGVAKKVKIRNEHVI